MDKPNKTKKLDSKELLLIKEELRKKLEAKECYLFDNKTPSKVWKYFQLIKESKKGTSTGYVRCIQCKNIFKHDNTSTGTSHLRKHLENCGSRRAATPATATSVASDSSRVSGGDVSASRSNVLTSFFTKATPVNKRLKRQMLEGAMAFCAFDMRPFEALKGRGLEQLIDAAIAINSSHGAVKAKDLLPDPTTVSRNLKKILKTTRSNLVPFFSSLIDRGLCAATTDMWSDAYRRMSYTTVTLQYTDSDWNVVTKVLFTCVYPSEKRKTAVNVREEICSKFTELGFKKDVIQKNVTFVTDQGPNIVKALRPPFKRLNCCAHIINTVLRNLFKPELLNKHLPKVQSTLVAAKALVSFLKHSGISSQLKTTVHQEIETRWNSRLEMLVSVYNNFNDISNILKERQLMVKLKGVNEKIIKLLIDFLEPFKAASDALEGDGCTINLVLPEYVTLITKCEEPSAESVPVEAEFVDAADYESEESGDENSHSSEFSDDDIEPPQSLPAPPATHKSLTDIIPFLKRQAHNLLLRKFLINDTHRVAMLLTPVAKDVGLNERSGYCTMTLEDRQRIIQELRDQVALEQENSTEQPASQPISEPEIVFEDGPSTSTAPQQPFKKVKLTSNERLFTFVRKSQVETVQHRELINEVDTYFNSTIICDVNTDVLQWWRVNSDKYPILSNIARKILCIPASSASSERVFSAAGHLVQKRRASLSPDSVDAILFLNSNADFKSFSLGQMEEETQVL